jgi:hypothetical protein
VIDRRVELSRVIEQCGAFVKSTPARAESALRDLEGSIESAPAFDSRKPWDGLFACCTRNGLLAAEAAHAGAQRDAQRNAVFYSTAHARIL